MSWAMSFCSEASKTKRSGTSPDDVMLCEEASGTSFVSQNLPSSPLCAYVYGRPGLKNA